MVRRVTINIDTQELLEVLCEEAKKQNRGFHNFIETFIRDYANKLLQDKQDNNLK